MRPGPALRIALLACLWGSGFLWIKVALEGMSPVQITFARLALGGAILLLIVRARGLALPKGAAIWGHLAVAAFVANALPYTLFAIGERSADSSLAGAINASTPLWTAALGLAVGVERRPTPRRALGLLVGFAGALLLVAPWRADVNGSFGGAMAFLAASASYGISYLYMARYLSGRGIPPLVLAAAQLLAATAWLALAVPVAGRSPLDLTPRVVASILVLGVLGTGLAYVLNYRIISDHGPVAASTVTYLLPAVAVALGAALLDEQVTPRVVLGTLVVLVGVLLVQRTTRR